MTDSQPTEITVVSSDYKRNFWIPLGKAREFYKKGTVVGAADAGFLYMLPRCKSCLLKPLGCEGGGICKCKCHHYDEVHAERVPKPTLKKKESWQAKRKREAREKQLTVRKTGRNWTKGIVFSPIGCLRVEYGMLGIVLQFTGVTQNGQVFVADVVQANDGWAVSLLLNGTQRGSYESQMGDLRAAVIEAVDRLS